MRFFLVLVVYLIAILDVYASILKYKCSDGRIGYTDEGNIPSGCSQVGNEQEIKSIPEEDKRAQERYLRLIKATREITPDQIGKLVIVLTHKGDVEPNRPNPSLSNDVKFYQSILSYIKTYQEVNDPSNSNPNLLTITDTNGNIVKSEMLNRIRASVPQTPYLLVFYSGHGTPSGKIDLPLYNQQSTRSLISPEELTSSFSQQQYLAYFNDSCYSGVWEQRVGTPPLHFLVHSTQATENTYTKIGVGGALMSELKARLKTNIGCKLDAQGTKDLVLTLEEWTHDMSVLRDPDKLSKEIQFMGRKTSNHPIPNLPIHVYTASECRDEKNTNLNFWNENEEYIKRAKTFFQNGEKFQKILLMDKIMRGLGE